MIRVLFYILVAIILIPVALVREYFFMRSHRQEIDMKKRTIVLSVLGIIILIIVTAVGWFVYKTDYEKSEINTYDNGSYQLKIYQVGTPVFPYGEGKCRFILNKDGKKIDEMDIWLANDGKWPDTANFDVSWNKDSVSITAHGEEQEDRTYVLYYGKSIYVLDEPQQLRANFISFNSDGLRAVVCDPMDNDIFPKDAQLTVMFNEDTYIIDLDGSVTYYDPSRKLFEPEIGKKFRWSEGMVIQIQFTAYQGYNKDNGFRNLAIGRRIENVDVVAVDAE